MHARFVYFTVLAKLCRILRLIFDIYYSLNVSHDFIGFEYFLSSCVIKISDVDILWPPVALADLNNSGSLTVA